MSVIHPENPQTWNMYAYVANNPTTTADPTGLDPLPAAGDNPDPGVNGETVYYPDTDYEGKRVCNIRPRNANGTANSSTTYVIHRPGPARAEAGRIDVTEHNGL